MFEAVGLKHYDEFFAACDRLLTPDGAMLMQTITVDDWRFAEYLETPELDRQAHLSRRRSWPRSPRSSRRWRASAGCRCTTRSRSAPTTRGRCINGASGFTNAVDDVHALGFDARFMRMWDLYLGYCEAAFQDRHIGNVQLLFAKPAASLRQAPLRWAANRPIYATRRQVSAMRSRTWASLSAQQATARSADRLEASLSGSSRHAGRTAGRIATTAAIGAYPLMRRGSRCRPS